MLAALCRIKTMFPDSRLAIRLLRVAPGSSSTREVINLPLGFGVFYAQGFFRVRRLLCGVMLSWRDFSRPSVGRSVERVGQVDGRTRPSITVAVSGPRVDTTAVAIGATAGTTATSATGTTSAAAVGTMVEHAELGEGGHCRRRRRCAVVGISYVHR
jgi:hypothetical protein